MLFSPQLIVPPPRRIVAAAGLGLQTSLGAFWSLENTSWTDDTGNGTTLTGNGTPPGTGTGRVGNGVSLNGSTDYLSAVSNTNIAHGGASFSLQAWVNLTAGFQGVMAKTNNAFGDRDWSFGSRFTGSANNWSWSVYNVASSEFICDSTVAQGTGWHHLVGTYNSSSGALKLYVDSVDATSGTPTVTSSANSSSAAPFNIGRFLDNSVFATGVIDQVGFWKSRVLSAGDVTALYNTGSGLSYAAMA